VLTRLGSGREPAGGGQTDNGNLTRFGIKTALFNAADSGCDSVALTLGDSVALTVGASVALTVVDSVALMLGASVAATLALVVDLSVATLERLAEASALLPATVKACD